jgi:hypothetical protein
MTKQKPAKIRKMDKEKIIEYEEFFSDQLRLIGSNMLYQKYREQCQNRLELLRSEIDLLRIEEKAQNRHKSAEEKADQRHDKSYTIEKWILGFAIAGVVIGTLTLSQGEPASRSGAESAPTPIDGCCLPLGLPPLMRLPYKSRLG